MQFEIAYSTTEGCTRKILPSVMIKLVYHFLVSAQLKSQSTQEKKRRGKKKEKKNYEDREI